MINTLIFAVSAPSKLLLNRFAEVAAILIDFRPSMIISREIYLSTPWITTALDTPPLEAGFAVTGPSEVFHLSARQRRLKS